MKKLWTVFQSSVALATAVIFLPGCFESYEPIQQAPVDTPAITFSQSFPTEEDLLHMLKPHDQQMEDFCARQSTDKVRKLFCEEKPTITSLKQLREELDLNLNPAFGNSQNGNAGWAITAHSSSLVGKFVSAINPRVVMFTPNVQTGDEGYLALGFTRGEQLVELAAHDPTSDELKFFLVAFEQACNEREEGCHFGDLLTPSIESNWTKVTVYEDTDLKNTVLDCLQCHQPTGPDSDKIYRMQELRNPWTHWMRGNAESGQTLLDDYFNAHGNVEEYGSIPATSIPQSNPALLEQFIINTGFEDIQLNQFNGAAIEQEVIDSSPGQPVFNLFAGSSPTWDQIYDQFVQGNFIAPPFHDVKVTDPNILSIMTTAYQQVRFGQIAPKDLPDIRKVLRQDKAWAMGFAIKPGLSGEEIITQACTQCYNGSLDQSLSRAKFHTDLGSLSREQKDRAIDRLLLPDEHLLKMPPARFRTLTDEEIQRAIEVLKQ